MSSVRNATIRRLFSLVMLGLALLVMHSPVMAANDDPPAWLRQAAGTATPSLGKNVPAVVLLREHRVTVDNDGKVTTIETGAIRILTSEGSKEATAGVAYVTDGGKVRELRGWLMRATGEVKSYGKDDVIDKAAAPNDIYNEVRIKRISAAASAEAGMIFGYQWITEERAFLNQDRWLFQEHLPAVVSRYNLTLPTGWHAESITFNHSEIKPSIAGNSYSWELHDLTFVEEEVASPSIMNTVPQLAISYTPPAATQAGASFNRWPEVSRWLSQLSDPQAFPDEAIKSKAQALTAHAQSDYERIRAIAEYVQKIQYISIQSNIARGGGYRPHAAAEVFAKSYGDCKDKANLMRAMLKTLNLNAYPLVIYSGDPNYVREEWPSPQQFNHCIVAVQLKEESGARAIVAHPSLGKLLIFDPTDDVTTVGDLPDHEQNSFALLVAGDAGMLMRMPVTSPEANLLERTGDLILAADGMLSGTVQEQSNGQAAVQEQRAFRYQSPADYQKGIEELFTRESPHAKLTKIEPLDSRDGKFKLNMEFNAVRFGQLMQQNRLLVFNPSKLARRELFSFNTSTRKHPILLPAHAYQEVVRIKLPLGFEVDELPEAAKQEAVFGTYQTSYEIKDGYLFIKRALIMKRTLIPAEQYKSVREFFDNIGRSEQAPVVLVKKA